MFSNIVLVSTVQKLNQLLCIHISPPSWACLPPSLIPPSSLPTRSSQSVELSSLCYRTASHELFYTWWCVILKLVSKQQGKGEKFHNPLGLGFILTVSVAWKSSIQTIVKLFCTGPQAQGGSRYRPALEECSLMC